MHKQTVHIVPHQHFDIIWRREAAWYKQRRAELYTQALTLLETHPETTFTFSQAAPIREFLTLEPRWQEPMARLLNEGRLEIIGGSETIFDLNMPSPGAIIDNMAMGLDYFKSELGYRVTIGAFEDAFGMPAQLPAILTLFDFRFYKSDRMPRPELPDLNGNFIWSAKDGTSIHCISPKTNHSEWGWGYPQNPDSPTIPSESQRSATVLEALLRVDENPAPHILFTIIGEEHDIVNNLPGILSKASRRTGIEFVFSTYSRYYDSLEADYWSHAPHYGPDTDLARVFTGCYTSRIDSKLNPRCLEYAITGQDLAAASTTEPPAPEKARQALCILQSHDAVCGCHIDENANYLNSLAYGAGVAVRSHSPSPSPPRPPDNFAFKPIHLTHGDFNIAVTDDRNLSVCFRDRELGAFCHLIAREDNGTLWTEAYSGCQTSLIDEDQVISINEDNATIEIVTCGIINAPHTLWPGFSSMHLRKSLRFTTGSTLVDVRLELWWMGCATEIAVAWSAAGAAITDCTTETPFGTTSRHPYTPTKDTMTGSAFPALNWVRSGDVAIFNSGTPGHAIRDGLLETILLRSPVKRWSPLFPVTPSDASRDNGYHSFAFQIDLDAGTAPLSDLHRCGIRFNLPNPAVLDNCSKMLGLPSNIVLASMRPEEAKATRVLIFEADGIDTHWITPDGRDILLPPHGIKRELINEI